jgi:Restriction endonuclease
MKFDAAADDLQRREYARFAAAVTPRPEQLRSLTAAMLRTEVTALWEALGHTIITSADAPWLVHVLCDRKYITICGNPVDPLPAGTGALRRLRDHVVAGSADRGFYISVRGFTAEARHFAETAPVQLLDYDQFINALGRVRKAIKVSPLYEVMCRHCGDIVQHSLDDSTPKHCDNGHTVPQPIARADFEKPPASGPAQPAAAMLPRAFGPAMLKYRDKSPRAARRRAIKAHNCRRWNAQATRLPYRGEP